MEQKLKRPYLIAEIQNANGDRMTLILRGPDGKNRTLYLEAKFLVSIADRLKAVLRFVEQGESSETGEPA